MLLNLVNKNLTGRAADAALSRAYITVNKKRGTGRPAARLGNQRHPHRHARHHHPRFQTGGSETGRHLDCDILDDIDNEEVILAVREKVSKLCAEFPVYG